MGDQNTGAAASGDGNQETTAVTRAELEALEKRMGQRIEASVRGLGEVMANGFDALQKQREPDPSTRQQPEGSGKPQGGDDPKGDASPEVNALRQQMASLQQQLEKQQKQAAQERAAARTEKLRNEGLRLLGRHGVSGVAAQHALNSMLAEGLLEYESDKSDKLIFRSPDGPLPAADGVESWVASPDGEIFRPASNAAGSGSNPAGSDGGKSSRFTDADLAAAIRGGVG